MSCRVRDENLFKVRNNGPQILSYTWLDASCLYSCGMSTAPRGRRNDPRTFQPAHTHLLLGLRLQPAWTPSLHLLAVPSLEVIVDLKRKQAHHSKQPARTHRIPLADDELTSPWLLGRKIRWRLEEGPGHKLRGRRKQVQFPQWGAGAGEWPSKGRSVVAKPLESISRGHNLEGNLVLLNHLVIIN